MFMALNYFCVTFFSSHNDLYFIFVFIVFKFPSSARETYYLICEREKINVRSIRDKKKKQLNNSIKLLYSDRDLFSQILSLKYRKN